MVKFGFDVLVGDLEDINCGQCPMYWSIFKFYFILVSVGIFVLKLFERVDFLAADSKDWPDSQVVDALFNIILNWHISNEVDH